LKTRSSLRDFFYFANNPALKRRAIFRGSVGTTIFALAESVFTAAETVTPNAPATSGKFILDRPHLNPLPEERTSPATLLFRPAIVRPIPPQTFQTTREQFLLLLGEKAGMREDSKIISQTATPQFSPDFRPSPSATSVRFWFDPPRGARTSAVGTNHCQTAEFNFQSAQTA
jgi:hypothetical protein